MKSPLLALTLAGAAAAAPSITDRITTEEIAARQKSISPLATIPQPVVSKGAKVARPNDTSLIEQSEILNDGIHWTLVPKGSVLHIPPAFASRVHTRPLGKLLTWIDFLTVNRNWLFTEEVTVDQAAGKKPFLPSRRETWNKNGKVVVAVYYGGPISVRPEPVTPVASSK